MNAPWTTRTTAITPEPATSSPPLTSATTNFHTMPPGTYTVSAGKTVSVIIVPGPEPTAAPASSDTTEPTASTLSTVTRPRVITIIETTVVTVAATRADEPTETYPSDAAATATRKE